MRSTHNIYKHYALELSFGKNDIVFYRRCLTESPGGNNKEELYEKDSDCHRRLWWNRRLDRKTTGERWIFGGRELRGKTGPSTSRGRRSQGCRRTGHRCASRCGKCRRRGAPFQRVEGRFRKTRCGGPLRRYHAALSDCQRRRGH